MSNEVDTEVVDRDVAEMIDFGDELEPGKFTPAGHAIEIFLYGDREEVPEEDTWTEADAEYAAGKIKSACNELKDLDARYKSMKKEKTGKIAWFKGRYEGILAKWTAKQIAGKYRGSRPVRSVKLLSGTCGMTKEGGEITIDTTHPDFEKWFRDHLPLGLLDALDTIERFSKPIDDPLGIEVDYLPRYSYSISPLISRLKPLMVHSPSEDWPNQVVDCDTGELLAFARYVPEYDKFAIK